MKSPIDVLRSFPPHGGTLHEAFSSRCQNRQDDTFIIQSEVSLTWRQFRERYDRLARVLKGRGIGPGDRVAVVGRNDISHLLALFALARLGATMVPVNPDYSIRELTYALNHADVKAIIAQAELLKPIEQATQAMAQKPWALLWGQKLPDDASLEQAIDNAPDIVLGENGSASDT
ncbi:MAG: AMP-binding protein, partial [Advenella sp.]